jgi:regulator of protease activity HflC (stomatin/prohibitin superfamily)
MDRHQMLHDQLTKAIEAYKEAKEMEELSKKHSEINRELKDKANAALQKDLNGQIVSDAEQTEIDNLAKEQEKVYRQMADKILKK